MTELENQIKLDDPFLIGRSIYLRTPQVEKDIVSGNWHQWFNDLTNTQFLVHGVFPMTRELQADLINSLISDSSTLLLCIINKKNNENVGVISLKSISMVNRTAEIGIVTFPHIKAIGTGAIEAMSLLMKHAFDRLNLEMLYAGQHEGLWKWINSLSMVGFEIDGFRPKMGVRNGKSYGVFLTSVSAENFYALEEEREGDILNPSPLEILRSRSKNNPVPLAINKRSSLNSDWLD